MTDLAFPFGFDAAGRTASAASGAAHIADMIEQILFTAPGERVNRPTFGSGTAQLVFEPNSDVLAAVQQQAIQAGLQQWLSDLIRVQSVTVTTSDATLQVTVTYTIVASQQQLTRQFVYGTAPAAPGTGSS
jgi:Bacteriophage baseplate protein W